MNYKLGSNLSSIVRSNRSEVFVGLLTLSSVVLALVLYIPEIESLIKQKISWILKKQREILHGEKKIEIAKPVYSKGSTLPYLGNNHKIQVKILDSQKENNINVEKNSVKYKNGTFVFNIKPSIQGNLESNDEIKMLYENWLYHKAKIVFKEKVHILSKAIGV